MLKKAGIVVAAAAAGLLALSPLAFAHDGGETPEEAPPTTVVVQEGDTTSRSPECTFDAAADNSVDQEGVGGSSLLGVGGLVSNLGSPINAQTQAPVGSCNNIEDVIDTTVEDNFQDNSETSDETSTEIDDSFNTED